MIPKKYAPFLFSLILSGAMSFIVSGIATLRLLGWSENLVGPWMSSWQLAWMIAFPVVSIVAPLTRRLVDALLVERV